METYTGKPQEGTEQQRITAELQEIYDNRGDMKTEIDRRKDVLTGLTPVHSGRIQPGESFRFLVTAAVQAQPDRLGDWLKGDGQGFRSSERPVNTSLIDQDHTTTFNGDNGFILSPPEDGSDIIAANSYDVGSNNMEQQTITSNADTLLADTDPASYNHINIAAGNLLGVYIRLDDQGRELGNPEANAALRNYAEKNNLPIVEIPVEPLELRAGEASMQEVPANHGNRLWQVKVPGEGKLHEVNILKLQPGEVPLGMNPDADGYDYRILEIDGYGRQIQIVDSGSVPGEVERALENLNKTDDPDAQQALRSVLRRLGSESIAT